MRTSENPRQPYPGLRPFEASEADVFFGREEHVDALLERLSASHFVAVVGESGAGKSSLVRAGLLPALEAGFVVEAGSDWRVALMRPGGAPLTALADALLAPGVLSQEGGTPHRAFALAELRRGPLGLAQLVRDAHLGESCNTLIVVDQFEELFRYCREPSQKDQANIFVELLLHSSRQRQVPIFVVLTMRSDFVGDCARFRGLPEMLNDNQYLTPRLTREQIAAAIREPARVCGGALERAVVDELCNAVGDDQDQLPLLQHLLMRLWEEAAKQPLPSELSNGRQPPWPHLTSVLSMNVGNLHSALSNHAQQIYDSLPADRRAIARTLFKCLTDPQSQRRDVRRDALVSEVAAVADASVDDTIAVADEFRADGRHMLMPPSCVPLDGGSRLDISHESLIRQWSTLGQWASEEGTNAREFIRLRDEAQREHSQQGELLSGRALARAQDWLKHAEPTPAWAQRYGEAGDFEATLAFIHKSEDDAQQRRSAQLRAARREANVRRAWWMVGSIAIVTTIVVGVIVSLWQQAERQRELAEERRHDAESQRASADEQRQRADESRLAATRNADRANELSLRTELQNQVITQQNTQLASAQVDARANLLTLNAERALERDAELAVVLARLAIAEQPPTGRTLTVLRDALAAHVPDVQPDFPAAHFRNYIPGKNKTGWLDFALSPASLSPIDDSAITPSGADAVIWSTTTGARIHTLQGHAGIVGSAIFSPDGRTAVTTGSDHTVRLWDVATGKERRPRLEHGEMVNGAVFNRDGTLLVTLADDTNAKVWTPPEFSAPRCNLTLDDQGSGENTNFVLASFSQDQQYLATVTHRNRTWQAQVWNVTADQCPRVKTPLDELPSLRWAGFSPYGQSLAAVTIEGEVIVLTVPDWTEQRRFKPNAEYPPAGARGGDEPLAFHNLPPAIAWSADGRYVAAAGGDNAISIAAVTGTATPIELRGHTGRVTSISFASGDASLLTTSTDATARIWRLAPDKQVLETLTLTGHGDAVGSAVFSPKSDRVVTAGDDGTVRAWTPQYTLREWRQTSIRSAAYSSDGTRIWVTGVDGGVIWASELSANTLLPRQDAVRTGAMGNLSFLGTKIVERENSGVRIRDLRDLPTATPLTESSQVSSRLTRISPGGTFVLASPEGKDASVLLWNLTTAQAQPEKRPLPSCATDRGWTALGVSDDGQAASYCAENNLVLITRAARFQPIPIRIEDQTRVGSARFSRSGRLLALALDDYSVRVFDSNSGRAIATMKGHSGQIRGLDFSGDDRLLVTASEDSTARVWEAGSGLKVAHIANLPSVSAASFSQDGVSLLFVTTSRILTWRCYTCGDTAGLLAEVQRRKINRKFTPEEQDEYRVASEKPGATPSERTKRPHMPLQALR